MLRRPLFAVVLASAVFYACTGDDPVTVNSAPVDAGGGSAADAFVVTDSDVPAPADVREAGPRCYDEDPFGPPLQLASGGIEGVHPRLTDDELEIVYQPERTNKIVIATRSLATQAFNPAQPIDPGIPLDASAIQQDPAITGDGLTLYLVIDNKLYRMKRATRASVWQPAVELTALAPGGSSHTDLHITPDGGALYFVRYISPTQGTLYRTTVLEGVSFGTPQPVSVSAGFPQNPTFSADEKTIYFTAVTTSAIFRSLRDDPTAAFGRIGRVNELNISSDAGGTDRAGWLSPDNCRIYTVSGQLASSRIYVAERKPR